MMVLLKVAWRNVWRNKVRSAVVLVAVMLGVWALIFALGFMNGFVKSYLDNAIKKDIAHVQIHHNQYKLDSEIIYCIAGTPQLKQILNSEDNVEAYSFRLKSNGMVASAKTALGVEILGIDSIIENAVSDLKSEIIEGQFLQGVKRNPVVIGKKTADKLNVKVRSKVVLTFRDREGELVSAAFRVAGIIESVSAKKNGMTAIVREQDIRTLLKLEKGQYHELAILANDQEQLGELMQKLKKVDAVNLVEDWRTIAPELELMQNQSRISLGIIVGIIMLALCFGIINTMLMAVLERFRELGMLMAVGMKKANVFTMIVLETILLSITAGPFGLLFGWLTLAGMEENGIDLSQYSEGLEKVGIDSILRPYLASNDYMMVVSSVMIMAVIAAVFPALRAVKLDPIEALHKI